MTRLKFIKEKHGLLTLRYMGAITERYNLASILYHKRDYVKAEKYQSEAMNTRKKILEKTTERWRFRSITLLGF